MKAKKVIELALIGVFLLLTATTVLASKEVEVESITCPSTIVIGTFTSSGEFGGTITLSFEEYIKGVVPYEMFPSFPSEALKVQAIAARNYAVRNMGRHSSEGYDLCNKKLPSGGRHCQAWEPPEDIEDGVPNGYPERTNAAVDNTSGIGVTYNDAVIDSTYFSSSRNHYTKNAEEKWNYCKYRRKTITPESTSVGAGGHGVGMSQYGAKKLADDSVTYQDILKHYYGPVPPYVKKVIVTQKDGGGYKGTWTDNNDYPNPTRKLGTSTKPFNGKNDINITIEYSEEMVDKTDKPLELYVGSVKVSISLNSTHRKATGVLTKKMIEDNKMNGEYTLKLIGYHKHAQDWQLDKNPKTFCYQNHNASILVNYDEGPDENHKITIDLTPPKLNKPTALQGKIERKENTIILT